MLCFLIPLKSEQLSKEWDFFCSLFERTLKSVCNQTNENFKIIVACHEVPDLNFKDPRIEYHQVSFDVPKMTGNNEMDIKLKENDKANKILAAGKVAEKYNPNYVMVVDADDCISNNIVNHALNDNKATPGWFVNTGYFYKEGKKYALKKKRGFNLLCGTCLIVQPSYLKYLISGDDLLYFEHKFEVLNNTIELSPLPFPGAVYSMMNGENHLMSLTKVGSMAKGAFSFKTVARIFDILSKYNFTVLNKKLRNEFGLISLAHS